MLLCIPLRRHRENIVTWKRHEKPTCKVWISIKRINRYQYNHYSRSEHQRNCYSRSGHQLNCYSRWLCKIRSLKTFTSIANHYIRVFVKSVSSCVNNSLILMVCAYTHRLLLLHRITYLNTIDRYIWDLEVLLTYYKKRQMWDEGRMVQLKRVVLWNEEWEEVVWLGGGWDH